MRLLGETQRSVTYNVRYRGGKASNRTEHAKARNRCKNKQLIAMDVTKVMQRLQKSLVFVMRSLSRKTYLWMEL